MRGRLASLLLAAACGSTTAEGPGGHTCDAACTEIWAYPWDAGPGCVDTSTHLVVGCSCDANGGPGCVRWTEDGRLFKADNADKLLFTGSEPAQPADLGWERCSDQESGQMVSSCDLVDCPHEPYSSCSLADTCADAMCSDAAMILANGCARQRCQIDSDCSGGEVCTEFSYMIACEYWGEGDCLCGMRAGGPPDLLCAPP